MKWLKAHKLFSIIMGVVLALCLLLVFSYSTLGGSTIAGQGVQKATSFISKPITKVSSGINNFFTGVFSYGDLQDRNEELEERVAELEEENKELQLTQDELDQLEELSKSLNFTEYTEETEHVTGSVIEIDNSNPYVTFTIDVGTEEGIEKDSIVMDGNGLVGKVFDTGKGWSKVQSIMSEGNNISFRTLRDRKVTGVVTGNGEDGLEGYVLDEDARIVKDDVLVTTGIGIYPSGIRIGKVSSVERDEDKQQMVVKVKPTCEFSGMQKVVVYI